MLFLVLLRVSSCIQLIFFLQKVRKEKYLFLSKYAPIQNTLQAKKMHFGWFLLLMWLAGLHSSLVMEFLKDENLRWWIISYKVRVGSSTRPSSQDGLDLKGTLASES